MIDKVDFDEYTDNYNELLREGTKFFSTSEEYFAKYKIDLLAKKIESPVKRILEYGCGIGRNVKYLQKAFPSAEIVGTDISAASLAIASGENPDHHFELEVDDLDLGVFDLIFVAGVYHHILPSERLAITKLLKTRISKTGSLCIFEHNPFNPVTRKIVGNCQYDADAVLLKPAELKSLIQNAELKFCAKAYCLFIPPKLSKIAFIENYLEWLPLGGQYWIRASFSE